MSNPIPAIYEGGVFRPLSPVDLASGTPVEISVATPPPGLGGDAATSPWREYLDFVESLPEGAVDDGFTNRDHDRAIYGE